MLLYYLYQLNQLFSHQTYVNFGCLATILIHLKKKKRRNNRTRISFLEFLTHFENSNILKTSSKEHTNLSPKMSSLKIY